MDTMSMVTYYNPATAAAMYRNHQHPLQAHHNPLAAQPVPPPSHHQYHPHHPNTMSWYPFNGHQSPAAAGAGTPSGATPTYNCMEEQNLWTAAGAHPPPPPPPNQMFANEGLEYHHMHQHQQQPMHHHHMDGQHHHHHEGSHQLPSPPITVSGSELSSPGAASGNVTPPNAATAALVLGGAGVVHHQTRPAPVRSPYEWIKKTNYTNQPNPGKTRTKDKYRVVYTDHQRVELEKEFYYSRYITIRRKAELASNLGLSERQVKIWFQNRRAKERKQVKKREEFTHKDGTTTTTSSGGIPLHPVQQQQQQHHQPVLIHHHHHNLQQQVSTSRNSGALSPVATSVIEPSSLSM